MAALLPKPAYFLNIYRASRLLNRTINPCQQSFSINIQRRMSHWHVFSALCLERKPVISQEMNPLEKKYYEMLQKMEFEGSLLSDHEVRHKADLARAEKLRSEDLEAVDLDVALKQTAQDEEDMYTEEFNRFKPASRTPVDNNNKKSLERHLDKSLVLVVQQKLGNSERWVLPNSLHIEGETLRQTSERVCREVCGENLEIQFRGNTPAGFYKYKYPKAAREDSEETVLGAKLFFFKAQFKNGDLCPVTLKEHNSIKDYMWLTHNELRQYLPKDYCKTIETFLVKENEELLEIDADDVVIEPIQNAARST